MNHTRGDLTASLKIWEKKEKKNTPKKPNTHHTKKHTKTHKDTHHKVKNKIKTHTQTSLVFLSAVAERSYKVLASFQKIFTEHESAERSPSTTRAEPSFSS